MLGILIIASSFKCYLNKLFTGCLALCTYIPCHVREERRRLQQSVYQMTSVWPWLNCFLAHQCSQCQSLRFRVPENNINVYLQTYCKGSPLIWTIFSKAGVIFIANDLDWPRNIGQSFWLTSKIKKMENHLNIGMLHIKWKLKISALQRNMSK